LICFVWAREVSADSDSVAVELLQPIDRRRQLSLAAQIVTAVSIVVDATDSTRLRRLMLELGTQSDLSFELVVVDRSEAGTVAGRLVEELHPPFGVVVVAAPESSAPAARNKAAKAARGRYLLFLAEETVPTATVVAEHRAAQEEGGGVVALGPVEPMPSSGRDTLLRAIAASWQARGDALASGDADIHLRDCHLRNLSVPAATFLRLGGFATTLEAGHARELCHRLSCSGVPLRFVERARIRVQVVAGSRGAIERIEQLATSDLELYRHGGPMLQGLELGSFQDAGLRELALRRILLALRPRPLFRQLIIRAGSHSKRFAPTSLSIIYWDTVRRSCDRHTWKGLRSGASILMYHAIGGPGEPASRFVVPLHRFARQMAALRRLGYEVLGLDELLSRRARGELSSHRTVVITFDDGYLDNLTLAAPVLRQLGFPATVFVVTRAVGGAGHWTSDPALNGRPLLSWEQLGELASGGSIVLGAHTMTHPSLRDSEPEVVQAEIAGSRRDLRANGFESNYFAYPYGHSSAYARTCIRQAGFTAALGIQPGRVGVGTVEQQLPRYEIRGSDRLLQFLLTLLIGRSRLPELRRTLNREGSEQTGC
jgi:peptidoglycan/xylan/chitin deacetylase (PgdA/CDA1 family)